MDFVSLEHFGDVEISRRELFRRAGLLSLALLPVAAGLTTEEAQGLPAFVAYHDRTAADHQAQWNNLYPQGYRMITLSVYGTSTNPLYAAVWVQRSGPDWVGIHNASAAQYQSFFDTWAARGYAPTILSVTGSGSNLVFAGTAEQTSGPIPLTRYNLVNGSDADPNTIEYWNKWAKQNNQIPRWLSVYGTATSRLYAGIWVPNVNGVDWNADGLADSADRYQQRFTAQSDHGARPAFVTLSGAQQYLSVFQDNSIGEWVARHNMTSSQYQTEAENWLAQGFYPIQVQGAGSGTNTRFAALFAKQETPIARTWRVTGTSVASLAAIDTAVKNFMQTNKTRSTAVAIVRDKRLVFARGYTWAEPSYPTTQPTSLFRIASCSKPITAIAIMQLVQQGLLSLDDRVQSILNLQTLPGMSMDSRFGDIRVWQLLCHMGGWDRSIVYDLPHPHDVAKKLGISLPVTKSQLARYKAGEALQFTPGSSYAYSNLGFLLLGLIIEAKRGQSYLTSVRNSIFTPLGLTRPTGALSPRSQQPAGAVTQHQVGLPVGDTVLSGNPALGGLSLASMAYGMEDYRTFDAFGGWHMAAVDYVKMLAAFNFGTDNPLLNAAGVQTMRTVRPEMGGRSNYALGWDTWQHGASGRGYSHGGGMPGVSTAIWQRSDGTAIAVFCNGSFGVPDINGVVNGIASSAWPSHNLFSSVGIPAFASTLVNLARNKSATQSSTAYNGTANLAVDGNTDGMYFNGSVTHTNSQSQAWWELDLGAVGNINRIDLYNRVDCCGERLANFYLLISDVPFTSKNLASTRAQAGVTSIYVAGPVGQSRALSIGRTGRYVRVQLAGTGILSLAEVQVWG